MIHNNEYDWFILSNFTLSSEAFLYASKAKARDNGSIHYLMLQNAGQCDLAQFQDTSYQKFKLFET